MNLTAPEFAQKWLAHFAKIYKKKEEIERMSEEERAKYISSYEDYTGD